MADTIKAKRANYRPRLHGSRDKFWTDDFLTEQCKLKVKNDHRSKFSNWSNWKEEAWKKSGLQRDSNPWPPRYQCVALPTELWSHTLGARFESRWSPDFFQASSFQLLQLENLLRWSFFTFKNWTALQKWIISCILHITCKFC